MVQRGDHAKVYHPIDVTSVRMTDTNARTDDLPELTLRLEAESPKPVLLFSCDNRCYLQRDILQGARCHHCVRQVIDFLITKYEGIMTITGQYLNLTDQVFAVVDDHKLFHNPGRGLLDLLIGWENPLPDLEGCWSAIEGNNDQSPHDQHGSRLMMLPQEVFLCIMEFCGNYEDVLRLSFTCRKALGKLVPLATCVRDNLGRAICDSNAHLDRPWNGKRVTFVFPGQSQQDAPFLKHVRSNILAAARKRGLTRVGPSVNESLRLLEDVHLLHREAEKDTQELGSPLPPGVYRPTAIGRVRPRDWYIPEGTTLYLTAQFIGQLPAKVHHDRYSNRPDVKTAKSNCELRHHWYFYHYHPLSEEMKHYRDLSNKELDLQLAAEEQRDCFRRNGDLTGYRLRSQVNYPRQRPYRIVNLDTLEHMDSSTVLSHFPELRFWYEDRPTFVLWVHVCYSPDDSVLKCGGLAEGEEFGRGRWTGHRLRYEIAESDGKSDHPCTTDITLEMISLAIAVRKALITYLYPRHELRLE